MDFVSSAAQSNGPLFLYVDQVGNAAVAGIVRIFYNNTWVNICDDGSFGMVEANVVCHQAGFARAVFFSNTGTDRYILIVGYVLQALFILLCCTEQFLWDGHRYSCWYKQRLLFFFTISGSTTMLLLNCHSRVL